VKIPDSARHGLAFAILLLCGLIWLTAGCDELVTEVNEYTIAGNPTAEFTITDTTLMIACVPCSVQFVDQSNGPRDGWLWRFGDGDSSTDTLPSHIYDSAGVFTVSLTVTDSETEGSDTEVKKHFFILGTSVQGISMSVDSGCAPLEVDFAPISVGGDTSYSWNFGDGSSAVTTKEPTHVFDTAGRYEVVLSVLGDCGLAIAKDSVIVSDCPELEFVVSDTVTTEGCRGTEFTFVDITAAAESLVVDKYVWDFGDGTIDTAGNDTLLVPEITHSYTDPGLYDVTMKTILQDAREFAVTREGYITIFDSANASFTASNTAVCFSPTHQVLLSFETSCDSFCFGDSLRWSFGDGTVDTVQNPIHAFVTAGIYEVQLIVWGCGVDTAIDTISLSEPLTPSFTITPGNTGDTSTSFQFQDQTAGVILSRNWSFGDGTPDIPDATPVGHRFLTPGAFEVKLTVTNSCGSYEAVDTVTVTAVK
jgi:PKD repeat protein